MMYGREVFRESLQKRIKELDLKEQQKIIKYEEYLKELQQLKDNFAMIKLKDEIKDTVDNFKEKVGQL